MRIKQELIYWWLPLIVLCFITYWLQINTYMDGDSAIISHTAAMMLQGETYTHAIFEPNPPLIFYLHMLPLIMSKITGIKIIYCLPISLLSLIFICVACSHYLFKKLFKNNAPLIYSMSYTFAVILLLMPVVAFGQREHLFLMLTLPYLLLAACRLDKISIRPSFALLVGLMAGIGFSIKPFFLPTLLLIELLLVLRQKKFWGWVRIESVMASLLIVLYVLSVIVFFPMYWQVVLPLWMSYYQSIVQPWWVLFFYPYFLFCCAALLLSNITKKNEQNASLKAVFRFAIVGCLIAFLIPRVVWYYHVFPAFSLSCLYFVLFIQELADKVTKSSARVMNLLRIAVMGLAVFSMPILASVWGTVSRVSYFHSDNPLRQLTGFLNRQGPNTSYDFFSMTLHLYDLEYYSSAIYVGNVSFFGWEYNRLSPQRYSKAYRDKILLSMLNIVRHDLDDKKPQFVIVDIPSSQILLKQRIDYPKEYSRNTHFRKAWSHYAYSTTIGPYEVYQRKSG